MKLRVIETVYLLILFFASLQWKAQNSWQNLTSGTTKDLYGLSFVDAQIGYISGASGTILKTNDGGTTWQSLTSGVTNALYGIYFVDANLGWVVGASGKILKTANGGNTWLSQSLGITVSGDLNDVFFLNATTGYIAGTFGVYKTSDGGNSWTLSHSSNSSAINEVQFKDANNGWSVGLNGKIRFTSNGGNTWTQVNASSSDDYYAVYATGSKVFVGGFKSEVLSSASNGSSWSSFAISGNVHNYAFLDDNNGWACGDYGKIFYTIDAGASWSVSTSGTSKYLRRIQFVTNSAGWAVGYGGTILKFTGGATPTGVNENHSYTLVLCPNPVNGIMNLRLDQSHLGSKYHLFNENGKELLSGVIEDENIELDLQSFDNGLYYFKVGDTIKKVLIAK